MISAWLWPGLAFSHVRLQRAPVADSPSNDVVSASSQVRLRSRRITVNLSGAAHDDDVLRSAMHYAVSERALLRIVLADIEQPDAFQDRLHLALLETVRRYGTRPNEMEVVSTSLARLPVA